MSAAPNQTPRPRRGLAAETGSRRRFRGFEPVAALTADTIRDAAGRRGFAVARLLTHWPEVVGADLARLCRPVRMGHGRGFGATLVLLTTGPHAPMIEMRLPQIRDKVNACFGYNAVARISLTQTAATGFAEGQARFEGPPAPSRRPVPPPTPAQAARAAETVAGIQDPQFRHALESLALRILADRAPTPSR